MNSMPSLQETNPVSLYETFEEEYARLCTDPNELPTDDSDDEEIKESDQHPRIIHSASVSASDMTITSSYCGKRIRFKGNQLILWARVMMQGVIKVPERTAKIEEALRAREVTIQKTDDWLVYEGLFDGFRHLLSKGSRPFYGIAKVFFGTLASSQENKLFTTVEFRNKINKKNINGNWIEEESGLLYAHIHDTRLISYLKRKYGGKYNYPSNYGLSYRDIVGIIKGFKEDLNVSDAVIAKEQLDVFRGNIKRQGSDHESVFALDLFLSYFNAILFGSEASRNSISFITGILVLDMIAQEKLTYFECFQPPSRNDIQSKKQVPYSVYPMASPHTGPNNFKAYQKLMENSQTEKDDLILSSEIGMQSSRKRAKWSQIHLKEAVLLKHWARDCGDNPAWLNASTTKLGTEYIAKDHGKAVEFARRFNERVIFLLNDYFPRVEKFYVYSPDEQHALGWFKPSKNIWANPENAENTQTDFNALDWNLSKAEPLKLEKIFYDVMMDLECENTV